MQKNRVDSCVIFFSFIKTIIHGWLCEYVYPWMKFVVLLGTETIGGKCQDKFENGKEGRKMEYIEKERGWINKHRKTQREGHVCWRSCLLKQPNMKNKQMREAYIHLRMICSTSEKFMTPFPIKALVSSLKEKTTTTTIIIKF